MKVIISHDVDHLYSRDHWFRDLCYPKLVIRESINFCKGTITAKEWLLRISSLFRHNRNQIKELVDFDLSNDIHSTFFFGMAQGLGMSYKPHEAKSMIEYVKNRGLGVGVHGIAYENKQSIIKEYSSFTELMGFQPEGIRMHYVRYNSSTFNMLNETGYLYDSTQFDKEKGGCCHPPYHVGRMWEFPLTIMDSYLPENLEQAKKITIDKINEAEDKEIEYITILLHDPYFSEAYIAYKQWYIWLINYLKESGHVYVSFTEAVNYLNGTN